MVVTIPLVSIRRITQFEFSANTGEPSGAMESPSGFESEALVAGPPSPE
jgi:hypothetical protein